MVKYGNKLLTFLAGGVDKTNNVSESIEIYSDKICPNVVNVCPFEMLNELEVEIKKAITPSVLNSKKTQSIAKLIETVFGNCTKDIQSSSSITEKELFIIKLKTFLDNLNKNSTIKNSELGKNYILFLKNFINIVQPKIATSSNKLKIDEADGNGKDTNSNPVSSFIIKTPSSLITQRTTIEDIVDNITIEDKVDDITNSKVKKSSDAIILEEINNSDNNTYKVGEEDTNNTPASSLIMQRTSIVDEMHKVGEEDTNNTPASSLIMQRTSIVDVIDKAGEVDEIDIVGEVITNRKVEISDAMLQEIETFVEEYKNSNNSKNNTYNYQMVDLLWKSRKSIDKNLFKQIISISAHLVSESFHDPLNYDSKYEFCKIFSGLLLIIKAGIKSVECLELMNDQTLLLSNNKEHFFMKQLTLVDYLAALFSELYPDHCGRCNKRLSISNLKNHGKEYCRFHNIAWSEIEKLDLEQDFFCIVAYKPDLKVKVLRGNGSIHFTLDKGQTIFLNATCDICCEGKCVLLVYQKSKRNNQCNNNKGNQVIDLIDELNNTESDDSEVGDLTDGNYTLLGLK
jgi:hypothetical protein